MLSDYRDAFLMAANAWSHALEAKQADVKRIIFHAAQLVNSTDLANPLAAVKAAKVRVVLVLGSPPVLRTIALEASASGMASTGWVWISDGLCAEVDSRGDTAEVRIALRFPPKGCASVLWGVFRSVT